MKKAVLLCVVFTFAFTSCLKNSSEYKELQAKNDSLVLANAQANTELDQILSLLNEVEDNFKSIKSAENYLSVQSNTSGELTPSTRERIQSSMKFVTETLDKNRLQIADLEKKLKSSKFNSSQLSKTLESLRSELEEKTTSLVALRDELEKKDMQIAELSAGITNLSKDVQSLTTQSNEQQSTISQQQKEINRVYYCFGTSGELKAQKILVRGQLGADFNRDYFIPENKTTLKVVPLYAKKGKLISKHPEGSYEFTKDVNGKAELRILDVQNFWSLTKYLVIQVEV
jgi:predicted  nucleic acid-binding Zn-ribbon protein